MVSLHIFLLLVDTSTKTVGYKEGSGFTHAYNDEPITFYPMEAHEGIRDVGNFKIMLCNNLRLIELQWYNIIKFNKLTNNI